MKQQIKKATANTGLAKVAFQCSADSFVVNQTLVLRINICGVNCHLRQARNRVCLESSPAHAGLNAVQEMEASIILRETIAKSERTGWSSC